ncbi:MAG: AmmeMemoRadiSam system protein A [SAR324 cluster bacterium]|jgi:AmmeMemoRadiSam system protein A|nr:AmmeMemoRadiSam system protein A [SAR324 cluster bacterium]
MTDQLSEESKSRLLRVARESLEIFLTSGQRTVFTSEIPELLKKRAVFVTLRKKVSGNLRGCVGQIEARYRLIEAVAKTAIFSAVDDSRFPPLEPDELPNLLIEINVLTPSAPIKPEAVEIGKHGLQLSKGTSGGLFLPEVALSNGWDRLTFLEELCRKADLPKGSWQETDAELRSFETESWEEN